MKNFKNKWYSLSNSKRALIIFISWFVIIALFAICLFIAPIIVVTLLSCVTLIGICFVFYLFYKSIEISEQESKHKYEEGKKYKEYLDKLK